MSSALAVRDELAPGASDPAEIPGPAKQPEGAGAPEKAHEARRAPMPGLTGIRTCLALTILMFHFTPSGLRWEAHPSISLYPIVDIGYVFVSFFFLISGFILSYNYAFRAKPVKAVDFWMARLSRLYPIYALTMLISTPFLINEYHVRSHEQFWTGVVTTPLLLQGWFPRLATFWMTVTWTLSCEVMLYLAFPWLVRLKWPRSLPVLFAMLGAFWLVGMIPHSIYVVRNPDHLAGMANRYSDGIWINTLKYTPLPYVFTFLAGLTLGRIHETWKLGVRGRTAIGVGGFVLGYVFVYHLVWRTPYILIHGGLMTPIFAMIILGLAGPGPLEKIFSVPPLLTIGTSTYALYLLHFNTFLYIHLHHWPERLHVARFDPWISYGFVVLLAVAARKWVEHPAQVWIKNWWAGRRAGSRVSGLAS